MKIKKNSQKEKKKPSPAPQSAEIPVDFIKLMKEIEAINARVSIIEPALEAYKEYKEPIKISEIDIALIKSFLGNRFRDLFTDFLKENPHVVVWIANNSKIELEKVKDIPNVEG